MARVFFHKCHTDVLLKSVFYYFNSLPAGHGDTKVVRQVWSMLAEANRCKRFVLEAETEDLAGRGGGDLIIKR